MTWETKKKTHAKLFFNQNMHFKTFNFGFPNKFVKDLHIEVKDIRFKIFQ